MKLSIETSGHGCDLVLIHGWAMHGGIFAPLCAQLASRFRLHAVDLPGHGRSQTYMPGDLDPLRVARAIAEQTPPALWLGWSLGGLVALTAALELPAQVYGLVEIASTPRFVSDEEWPHAVASSVFSEFGLGLATRIHATIERFLALETMGSEHARDELRALKQQVFEHGEPSAEALQEGLAILAGTDLRNALSRLDRPSLWIAGRRDRIVPPAAMRWAAEQCAHAQYLEVSAGHAPFLSHPVALADAIAAFAKSVIPA